MVLPENRRYFFFDDIERDNVLYKRQSYWGFRRDNTVIWCKIFRTAFDVLYEIQLFTDFQQW